MIRILGICTHSNKKTVHGVDFLRLVLPLETLQKTYPTEFQVTTFAGGPEENGYKDWNELVSHFDIIYLSYVSNDPAGYIQMRVAAMKQGVPIVMDLDDNIWEIPEGNPVKSHFDHTFELDVASKILEDVDYITTTNSKLKYAINMYTGRRHEKIKVLPNFVSPTNYKPEAITRKTRKETVIFYAGTTTHQLDVLQPMFRKALVRIVDKYPQVAFRSIGNSFLPQLKTEFMKVNRGKNYESMNGKQNVYDWFELWAKELSEADIVVAPLKPSHFCECKSDVKLKEFSLSGKPGVYQRIRQYEEHLKFNPNCGLLAGSEDEWFTALEQLVTNQDLREKMGKACQEYVLSTQTIEGNMPLFYEYFTKLLNK